ncbi:hypothetical protein HMPREF9120_00613 [Neisseria sp. oral taxon 020 str. F0370]|nr:hypothetical protein HMPREF9120_00613 [Neisseria sp. oral taxon 020 str. F0370]
MAGWISVLPKRGFHFVEVSLSDGLRAGKFGFARQSRSRSFDF